MALAQAVARSKEGLRLTLDMKLVFPRAAKAGENVDLLEGAHRMLRAMAEMRVRG